MLPDFSPTFAAMARTRAASQAGAPGRAVPSGAEGATGSFADEVSGPAAVTREAGADGPEGKAPDPAEEDRAEPEAEASGGVQDPPAFTEIIKGLTRP